MITIIVSSQGSEGDSGQLHIWEEGAGWGGGVGETLNKKKGKCV